MDPEAAGHFVLQVAVIILAAKLFGRVVSRYLKQPSVLGELVAGMIIGPFALGSVTIFGLGPLFPLGPSGQPELTHLRGLTVLASAVLLFLAGLETDVHKFLRYAFSGFVTGLGGAALSFALGCAIVVWTGHADSFTDPRALLMGTVLTATSVGLTARVLSERRKMDTAEGATILSGAVIDDILGLVLLAIVLSLAAARGGSGHSPGWGHIAWIVGKAGIFWIGTMAVGILCARHIGGFLKAFGGMTAVATAALGLAFLLAAFAEKAGLSLIIGAYTMGISLSQIDRAHALQERLRPVYALLVPIFFCVTGMMLDFGSLGDMLLLGLLFAAAGIVGKAVGCGAPAYLLGFNTWGAVRIGIGMMPRQEVALIVAGIGLSAGVLDAGMLGPVIVLTFVTTLLTPTILGGVFNDRSGLRRKEEEPPRASAEFAVSLPTEEVARLVAERMVDAFRREEFFVHHRSELGIYEMRKEDITVFLRLEGADLVFATSGDSLQYARIVVFEEMIALREIFKQASHVGAQDDMKRLLLGPDRP